MSLNLPTYLRVSPRLPHGLILTMSYIACCNLYHLPYFCGARGNLSSPEPVHCSLSCCTITPCYENAFGSPSCYTRLSLRPSIS